MTSARSSVSHRDTRTDAGRSGGYVAVAEALRETVARAPGRTEAVPVHHKNVSGDRLHG